MSVVVSDELGRGQQISPFQVRRWVGRGLGEWRDTLPKEGLGGERSPWEGLCYGLIRLSEHWEGYCLLTGNWGFRGPIMAASGA